MRNFNTLLVVAGILSFFTGERQVLSQQTERDTKVRNDKANVEKDSRWIYNDLPRAYDAARNSNKPLLIVFRCIPCEACSQFDELVVKRDPKIQKLMEEFICARIVQTNGLDLSLFQFDYDQSFHVFFMNAEQAIYGRYGTRSANKDEFKDMSMEGFAEAMQAALELHRGYPGNEAQLAGKKGKKAEFPVPEKYPSLKQYGAKIDYVGATAKSCIHCHQIRDAQREFARSQEKLLSEELLYPYPLPDTIGLRLDSQRRATVQDVLESSPAQVAGLLPGDNLVELNGQPLTSIADIQWILHQTPSLDVSLPLTFQRGDEKRTVILELKKGWRAADISWRPTTWELREFGLGGLKLKSLTSQERKAAGLPADAAGLQVEHLGWYGEHARAKNAGMDKGDVILTVDGKSSFATESELIAYVMLGKKRGEEIVVRARRGKEDRDFKFRVR